MDAENSTRTKTCKKCGECKPILDFNKKSTGRYGVRALCKTCQYADASRWRKTYADLSSSQVEALRAQKDAFEQKRNQRCRREESQRYYLANREKINARSIEWARANPEICAARTMKRLAKKKRATMSWSEHEEMDALYARAADLTRETGVKWHVDHIVPLTSNLVCGLHVAANLRVIPASENISKGNYYWPDMP